MNARELLEHKEKFSPAMQAWIEAQAVRLAELEAKAIASNTAVWDYHTNPHAVQKGNVPNNGLVSHKINGVEQVPLLAKNRKCREGGK